MQNELCRHCGKPVGTGTPRVWKFWYMRDNHTFKPLSPSTILEGAMEEFDLGYAGGMLCATVNAEHYDKVVHAHGKDQRAEFVGGVVKWISELPGDAIPRDTGADAVCSTPPVTCSASSTTCNMLTVGICGICGGDVQVPRYWSGTGESPPPTCASCFAVARPSTGLPVLPMQQPYIYADKRGAWSWGSMDTNSEGAKLESKE